jgi:hypothetical protein
LKKLSLFDRKPSDALARQIAYGDLSEEAKANVKNSLSELSSEEANLTFPKGAGVRSAAQIRVKDLKDQLRDLTSPSQEQSLRAQRLLEKRGKASVSGVIEKPGEDLTKILQDAERELGRPLTYEERESTRRVAEAAEAKRNSDALEKTRQKLIKEEADKNASGDGG